MILSEDSDIDVEICLLLETLKLNKHPAGVYQIIYGEHIQSKRGQVACGEQATDFMMELEKEGGNKKNKYSVTTSERQFSRGN